ncbi:DTW domain-containing protein [Alteromonas sp. MYP5]|uniref:tRNA-uridine aminocarboxypropyltransferase n=2 Tax=Alteromonas ponticola TaxID=2720613 RepID=A0ABX1R2G5_9ALTE|nr:tRNA-uridine aminocarboxypropyltransferase [Alteromonas ponticola]NMH60649.1 DTW domain-containing protein [Alteromonas ponticola]
MRTYCTHCHFPQSTCLCDDISIIDSPLSVIVLQHKKESSHAKNTVRLVKLAIPTTQVYVGKAAEDFVSVKDNVLAGQCGVVYPSAQSTPLENFSQGGVGRPLSQLIFIDGSWRQAYAIWQANRWLHSLPQFHLNNAPESHYIIRHVNLDHSLSTLEAVSHAVACVAGIDTSPLLQLQSAFQARWRSPQQHRRK